jgi:hypothetical protein
MPDPTERELRDEIAELVRKLGDERALRATAMEAMRHYRDMLAKAPLCSACIGDPRMPICPDWCQTARALREAN